MMQVQVSTDGRFVGKVFDPEEPLTLDGAVFSPEAVVEIGPGEHRFSTSNYVIETKEV